jgi:ABC-type glycerol-3-phosphate transport system substrate-binding protein
MNEERTKISLSRRQFLVNSAAAAALLGLVACAPGATESGGEAAEAPVEAAPAEVDPNEPVVGEYGSGGDPLVMWHGLGGADGATFAVMLEQYAEETGQAILSETYGWDVFFQKFPTSVAAGSPPDMSIFHAAEVPQMTDQGLIMPMDDIFFTSGLLPKDDFAPAIMSTITIEGNTMAIPFDNHGWNMYVNTKILEDAGLDPNNLPKNGAEFVDWALQITTDANGRHPGDAGFDAENIEIFAWHQSWPRFTYPSLFGMFGSAVFDADSNTATLNNEANLAAVQYVHDLMYLHQVAPPAVPGLPGGGDFMANNQLAFWWDGTWALNFFKDNPDIQDVTIAAPLSSFAPDGKIVHKIDAHIFALPVGIDDAARGRSVPMIEWLSNNGKTWATSGQIPARLSVQQDPDVQAIWSVKSASENFNNYGQTDVPHKAFIEIQTAWETALSAAVANTTPVEQALNEGNDAIQAILDRG